jgi:hypothetical protein
MADFLRKLTLQAAIRERNPSACRYMSACDACSGLGVECGARSRRFLSIARFAAVPRVFNTPGANMISYLRQNGGKEIAAQDFRLNAGGKLQAYSPSSAGYGCLLEDASEFPGSLAGDWLCALLARDRSLGSERNCYESGR